MVAHDANGVNEDTVASGGDGEDELEDEVRENGRLEKELSLGAAARNEVAGSRKDPSRYQSRHR